MKEQSQILADLSYQEDQQPKPDYFNQLVNRIMVFSIISRVLFPSIEKDLTRAIGKEVKNMHLEGCMLAPQAFTYERAVIGGPFGRSSMREAPVAKLIRVDRPIKNSGLFHD